jgi:RHS repeat-associated protein
MKTKHKHWAVLTASALGLSGLSLASGFGNEKYVFDASGNIVEKIIGGQVTKMSYDCSNKVTSIDSPTNGAEQIGYDAVGRPVSYTNAFGQSSRQLSFGYGDKVLNANGSMGFSEFFYNADGQLVGKSVAGEITSYVWDGNALTAEGSNAFTSEDHISGGLLVMAKDEGIVVSDYVGNTLFQAGQQTVSTVYGEGLEHGRFTGKTFIKELEGFVFWNRLYSPTTNRWVTADPSGFPDKNNNFSYVSGDPNLQIDPLGLEALTIQPTTYFDVQITPQSESGVNAQILFKVKSTFTTAPDAAEGVTIDYTGAYEEGYSYEAPTADIRLPVPGRVEVEIPDIAPIKYKAKYTSLTFHHDVRYKTPNSSTTIDLGDVVQTETKWAKEQ